MSLKNIGRLKPAEYSYNNPSVGDTKRLSMGIMAQDIDKVWPYEKYSILNKDTNNNYSVEYHQLIAPMVKAIQELCTKVEELEKKLNK